MTDKPASETAVILDCDIHELCRFGDGSWSLRIKNGDVHVRYLDRFESAFVDAALAYRERELTAERAAEERAQQAEQSLAQERAARERAEGVIRLYRDSHHYCIEGEPQGRCNKCRAADQALAQEGGKP